MASTSRLSIKGLPAGVPSFRAYVWMDAKFTSLSKSYVVFCAKASAGSSASARAVRAEAISFDRDLLKRRP